MWICGADDTCTERRNLLGTALLAGSAWCLPPVACPAQAPPCQASPFSTACLLQTDYSKRKYGASNPPYKRVFFEFSEEASQPDAATGRGPGGPAGAAGGEAAAAGDPLQLAFLQGQLRDKERRIQAVSTQLAEAEERGQRLERDLELARLG